MKEESEESAKQVMEAVNDAPDGQWRQIWLNACRTATYTLRGLK
jgi:hypothetical protein